MGRGPLGLFGAWKFLGYIIGREPRRAGPVGMHTGNPAYEPGPEELNGQ
tara:strand:+ start:423 stop:569 length:147 start_codon:yes stop_codon:yes gene_type:complete